MGSTGSGSLTDYSKRKPKGGASNGGSSGEIECGKAFTTHLEEVSRCFYFINFKKVPTIGTQVRIFFNGLRLSVETMKREEIGYLPTMYNYIITCMTEGKTYSGAVAISSLTPFPSVSIDITPDEN